MKPLGIAQLEAARRLDISLNRLNEIVLGKRGITADTALRLARMLKTSPQLWVRALGAARLTTEASLDHFRYDGVCAASSREGVQRGTTVTRTM